MDCNCCFVHSRYSWFLFIRFDVSSSSITTARITSVNAAIGLTRPRHWDFVRLLSDSASASYDNLDIGSGTTGSFIRHSASTDSRCSIGIPYTSDVANRPVSGISDDALIQLFVIPSSSSEYVDCYFSEVIYL